MYGMFKKIKVIIISEFIFKGSLRDSCASSEIDTTK